VIENTVNETSSLAHAACRWLGITGVFVGGYFLMTELTVAMLSGSIGWRVMIGSADKIGTFSYLLLMGAAALAVAGGVGILQEAPWSVKVLQGSAWLWLAGCIPLLSARIYAAATHGFGATFLHQRITLVIDLLNTLLCGVLYSITLLVVLRRCELRLLMNRRHRGFDPRMMPERAPR
jgi:hypothetical protein